MLFRRIVLYGIFIVLAVTSIGLLGMTDSDRPSVVGAILGVFFTGSFLGLVVWSIAYLRVEPDHARFALVMHLVLLVFLAFYLAAAVRA
jgi:hypothetical protein